MTTCFWLNSCCNQVRIIRVLQQKYDHGRGCIVDRVDVRITYQSRRYHMIARAKHPEHIPGTDHHKEHAPGTEHHNYKIHTYETEHHKDHVPGTEHHRDHVPGTEQHILHILNTKIPLVMYPPPRSLSCP